MKRYGEFAEILAGNCMNCSNLITDTHSLKLQIQETQGCGSRPMIEAVSAIQRVGNFFRKNESCKVTCQNMECSGAAPVKFNFNYHELPPATPADCQGARPS